MEITLTDVLHAPSGGQLSSHRHGEPSSATRAAIEAYFAAFNQGDVEGLLETLSDDVVHEINQGPTEVGKAAFRRYKAHMDTCYDEVVTELVIMTCGSRGAAEFLCTGRYLAQDGSLPPASGQKYRLRAAAFFTVEEGLITRITGSYNLGEFVAMVSDGGVS